MRKAISFALIMSMLFGVFSISAYATQVEPRESYVFSNYWAYTFEGEKKGEIGIAFSVTSSHPTTTIGVSTLEIYKSNGTHITTITGTIENGLLRNGGSCANEYYYQGISGVTYYAVVNFYGIADGITDTRTITTGTVTAP